MFQSQAKIQLFILHFIKLVEQIKPDSIWKFWFHNSSNCATNVQNPGSDIIQTLLSKNVSRILVFWRPQNTRDEYIEENMFDFYNN